MNFFDEFYFGDGDLEMKLRFGDLTMYVGTYPDKTIMELKEKI